MTDQPPLLPESPPAAPAPAPAMSLAARLLNIFATPGQVFEEVKRSRVSIANWLVPTLIYALVMAVWTGLLVSQPAMIEKMSQERAKQEAAIEQEVKAGKLTRQEADQFLSITRKFSKSFARPAGAIGGFFVGLVLAVGWAFVLWLIARLALKVPLGFMKAAEVAGLASAISVLEVVLRTLLVFGLHNPTASTSFALLLKNADPHNKLYILFTLLNLIGLWALVVRSIGLSRLAGVPFRRTAFWVFGAWVLLTMAGLTVGQAFSAAFGGLGG